LELPQGKQFEIQFFSAFANLPTRLNTILMTVSTHLPGSDVNYYFPLIRLERDGGDDSSIHFLSQGVRLYSKDSLTIYFHAFSWPGLTEAAVSFSGILSDAP
jgi:hypothetical protein